MHARLSMLALAALFALASAAPQNDPYAQQNGGYGAPPQGGYQGGGYQQPAQPQQGYQAPAGGGGDLQGACQQLCTRVQQCKGGNDQNFVAPCTQECVGMNPDPGQVLQVAALDCQQLLAALGQGGGGGTAPAGGATPAAGAGGGGSCPTAENTGDARLFAFLTANAWCYESYRASSNGSSSVTTKCRGVLGKDGKGMRQCGGETYSSGQGGTHASQGGEAPEYFCWKLSANPAEILLGNGTQYESRTLKIEDNGYGVFFLHVGKLEYRACN